MTGYLPVAVFLALIVGFGVVSLLIARFVRPRRPYAVKSQVYECGAETFGEAWTQFPVGFYLVALVFIVCDAAMVFLFPWALILRDPALGRTALAGMGAFFAIVGLGWLYAYREGILEWK